MAAETRLLDRSLHDFSNPDGRDLLGRCLRLEEWVADSAAHGLFQCLRHHHGSAGPTAEVEGWGGHRTEGLNLGSQDYLGLATHPAVIDAAVTACREYGTHSAGSEPMGAGSREAKRLERQLSTFLGCRNVVLFPTGWAAGYGAITALVRPYDHVVIDAFAHDCLRQGAASATRNVHAFAHNDLVNLDRRLTRIRTHAPTAAVLVVTESLFSMDSDHPDFVSLIDICRKHEATILVAVAHDLGCLGPGGGGLLAEDGLLGEVDIVVGSFSKSFASVGGFCATNSRGASYAIRSFAGSYTCSNCLAPSMVAAIQAALGIVRSAEGEALRAATLERALGMRHALAEEGLPVLGRVSPIVLPLIGSEAVARLASRHCFEHGVVLNCIEYPACRRGQARFQIHVRPSHNADELVAAARVIGEGVRAARTFMEVGA
jgi:7-keto-8-aminopelargonate synthetase-like enzyme